METKKPIIEVKIDKYGQTRYACLNYYFFSYYDAIDFYRKSLKK